MAEGYTRAQAGNIGVHRHLGAGRHRHDHGLYSASADSIPILCITGQAPRARLYKDFQAVDIESIAAGDRGRSPCASRRWCRAYCSRPFT